MTVEVTVPGDKSISHRALLIGALAEGDSRLSGLLAGADLQATAAALRALGVDVPMLPAGSAEGTEIRLRGAGLRGLRSPGAGVLDCGNSGTTARLLTGILAGNPVRAVLDGDDSLRLRPMRRVLDPLSAMGARFEELGEAGRLPLRVLGGSLRPIEYDLPVASAQVKSALLLAGLTGGVFALLTEPGRSRDHTERMLRRAGASVIAHPEPVEAGPAPVEAWRVELRDPPERLRPLDLRVPGDLSSAAFLVALALLGGAGDELAVCGVGLNPTRTGILPVLERMGADVRIEGSTDGGGASDPGGETSGDAEPSGTIVVRPSRMKGAEILPAEVPALIDELPVLAVLAARAEGVTRITGAGELRVKESDRLGALAANLRTLGVTVEELDDGLEIEGGTHPLSGRVSSFHDHRIAMAFGVLGALPGNRVDVEGGAIVDVSYPGFWDTIARLRRRGRSTS